MTFTVVWTRPAENELAAVWLAAADRAAVTAAAARMDAELARDGDQAGESRDPGVRVLLIEPLGVLLTVPAGARTVYVFRAWGYR